LVKYLLNQTIITDNGKCMVKGNIAGKNPVCLFGKVESGRKQFIVVPTRDGKGLQIVKNNASEKFKISVTKEVI
jgi:hypothetical protein